MTFTWQMYWPAWMFLSGTWNWKAAVSARFEFSFWTRTGDDSKVFVLPKKNEMSALRFGVFVSSVFPGS
jgi:hypothetical protein